jgi:hypothetical protein
VYGLDFSDAAIRLAKSVRKMYVEHQQEQRQQETAGQEQPTTSGVIHYLVGDALATGLESGFFDVVYDKGTFDSIACVSKKFVKSKKRVGEEEEGEDEDGEVGTTSSTSSTSSTSAGTGTTTTTTTTKDEEEEEEVEEVYDDEEDDRIKYCREVNRYLRPNLMSVSCSPHPLDPSLTQATQAGSLFFHHKSMSRRSRAPPLFHPKRSSMYYYYYYYIFSVIVIIIILRNTYVDFIVGRRRRGARGL